jgi:nucleoside-diphosphate-sugar epimerase
MNAALLRNTLDGLRDAGAPLRHVTLYQGHKFYGSHLGKFKVPAKETHRPLIAPNFYYAQEELLRERAESDGYDLTIFRPEAVIGYAQGTPMNLLMALAVYVSITRELGIPLRFPGVHQTYDQIFYQVSDAHLLAEATKWGGETPAAWGEAFNLTNGDIFHWREIFQTIAEHYNLPFEDPQPMVLAEHMPLYRGLWDEMRERYGLVSGSYESVVDWRFGDMILNSTWDNVSSTIKVRKAGFGNCYDSASRFIELLDDLVERKIIPPLSAR